VALVTGAGSAEGMGVFFAFFCCVAYCRFAVRRWRHVLVLTLDYQPQIFDRQPRADESGDALPAGNVAESHELIRWEEWGPAWADGALSAVSISDATMRA